MKFKTYSTSLTKPVVYLSLEYTSRVPSIAATVLYLHLVCLVVCIVCDTHWTACLAGQDQLT